MSQRFEQVEWSDKGAKVATELIRLAIAEDTGDQQDWTTNLLLPANARGEVSIVSRQAGVLAGLPIVDLVIRECGSDIEMLPNLQDGDRVDHGQVIATLSGSARDLLTAERIILNFLGHLSGIATLTHEYVEAIAGTNAHVYDTRKTTPGWRWLEKYAVRCGGGQNHRLGLHRAVMIKDNHVALANQEGLTLPHSIGIVRRRLAEMAIELEAIEVEVDTLEQLEQVLSARPDIVLLDNMSLEQLEHAVRMRDTQAPAVLLEASGGVTLATIHSIATTGVDRISVGALTHSFCTLDIGFDWQGG